MLFEKPSIQQKLVLVAMLASVAALLLTCLTFVVYELIAFRREMVQALSIQADIIAANSTASLAFQNPSDAAEVLSALKADRGVVVAALYDRDGKLFAKYPATAGDDLFPDATEDSGHRFEKSHLILFKGVRQDQKYLGTLFLKADLLEMRERFQLYGLVAVLVMGCSCFVAWRLSSRLQKHISDPILALAETAKNVTERKDYSMRARKLSDDELGLLTLAFNEMLAQIQERDAALRESEERLRLALESAGIGTWSLDLRRNAILSDDHLPPLFGLRHAHFPTEYEEFLKLLREEDRARFASEVARTVETDARFDTEYQVVHPSGALRILGSRGKVYRDDQGRPIKMTGVCWDVTDRRRAEGEILKLNQQLEQRVADRTAQLEAANKELEAFCYSVSHDLRAPLRHIDGFVQLLGAKAGPALTDKHRRFLTIISDSAKQMGQLIDDLLAFSRTGRAELRYIEVDLKDVVEAVILGFESETQGRNIAWKIGQLPSVRGDAAMLKQVLVNLIGNAIKYTRPRDPAEIEIGYASVNPEEKVVFVRDNGVGFQMEYADKLFGVFQRLHATEEFEGTGIGLANVRRIIERHGGRTWAEGRANEGATFYFSLPASKKG